MDKMYTIIDEKGVQHQISRHDFQVLHSAGRALLKQSLEHFNHSEAAAAYLVALDTAINAGHEVLGTERPNADQYIQLVRGVSELHEDQANAILEREGLLPKQA